MEAVGVEALVEDGVSDSSGLEKDSGEAPEEANWESTEGQLLG